MDSSRFLRKRATSMHVAPTYVSHVCEIDKALQQGARPYEHPIDVWQNPVSATKAVYHSLRANHSDISNTVFERFKSTFLRAQNRPECRKIIQTLLNQPMQVSNEELSMILQLCDSMSSRTTPSGSCLRLIPTAKEYLRTSKMPSNKG